MKNLFFAVSMIFNVLLASGCQSNHHEDQTTPTLSDKIVIKTLDEKIIKEITDTQYINAIRLNISKKEAVFLKKSPQFDAIIETIIDKNSHIWLYSHKGYIQSQTKKTSTVYKVNLPQVQDHIKN